MYITTKNAKYTNEIKNHFRGSASHFLGAAESFCGHALIDTPFQRGGRWRELGGTVSNGFSRWKPLKRLQPPAALEAPR
jgi:hypothetical protein